MGGYDLHVEFIKGYPIHIPIPQNIKFLNAKIDLIDHCLIELRNNETVSYTHLRAHET